MTSMVLHDMSLSQTSPLCFWLSQFPAQFFWMCSTIFDITALQMVLLGPWTPVLFPSSCFFHLLACYHLFPLLELSACASHVLQVVVRNSCISSSGRLLGLGTIIGLLTSLSTYCIYLVTMIMIMSRGTGFFLVHSNYILLWRIEWIRKGGKNLSPDLHVFMGACRSLNLIFGVFLDFFPNLVIEADFFFFSKHGYCHQFWLVLLVR